MKFCVWFADYCRPLSKHLSSSSQSCYSSMLYEMLFPFPNSHIDYRKHFVYSLFVCAVIRYRAQRRSQKTHQKRETMRFKLSIFGFLVYTRHCTTLHTRNTFIPARCWCDIAFLSKYSFGCSILYFRSKYPAKLGSPVRSLAGSQHTQGFSPKRSDTLARSYSTGTMLRIRIPVTWNFIGFPLRI